MIFAVLDASLAVNLCINCSFFTFIVHKNNKNQTHNIGAVEGMCRVLWLGVTFLVGNGEGQIKLINEQYFLVRKLGLGRGVVGLSLVITEVSCGGKMRR